MLFKTEILILQLISISFRIEHLIPSLTMLLNKLLQFKIYWMALMLGGLQRSLCTAFKKASAAIVKALINVWSCFSL